MRSRITRLVGVWISPLILVASLAVAAGPDRAARERGGGAGRGRGARPTRLRASMSTPREPDGVTALLWAAHWDDLAV